MKVGLFKSVLLNFLLFSGAYFVRLESSFLKVSIFPSGKANAAPIPDAILDLIMIHWLILKQQWSLQRQKA
jgi:hypothetical protein